MRKAIIASPYAWVEVVKDVVVDVMIGPHLLIGGLSIIVHIFAVVSKTASPVTASLDSDSLLDSFPQRCRPPAISDPSVASDAAHCYIGAIVLAVGSTTSWGNFSPALLLLLRSFLIRAKTTTAGMTTETQGCTSSVRPPSDSSKYSSQSLQIRIFPLYV